MKFYNVYNLSQSLPPRDYSLRNITSPS